MLTCPHSHNRHRDRIVVKTRHLICSQKSCCLSSCSATDAHGVETMLKLDHRVPLPTFLHCCLQLGARFHVIMAYPSTRSLKYLLTYKDQFFWSISPVMQSSNPCFLQDQHHILYIGITCTPWARRHLFQPYLVTALFRYSKDYSPIELLLFSWLGLVFSFLFKKGIFY